MTVRVDRFGDLTLREGTCSSRRQRGPGEEEERGGGRHTPCAKQHERGEKEQCGADIKNMGKTPG